MKNMNRGCNRECNVNAIVKAILDSIWNGDAEFARVATFRKSILGMSAEGCDVFCVYFCRENLLEEFKRGNV